MLTYRNFYKTNPNLIGKEIAPLLDPHHYFHTQTQFPPFLLLPVPRPTISFNPVPLSNSIHPIGLGSCQT